MGSEYILASFCWQTHLSQLVKEPRIRPKQLATWSDTEQGVVEPLRSTSRIWCPSLQDSHGYMGNQVGFPKRVNEVVSPDTRA